MNARNKRFADAMNAVEKKDRRRDHNYRGPLGKLLSELRGLLQKHVCAAARGGRAVGAKTRADRRHVMTRMLVDLYRAGYKLESLRNFRGKHIEVILGTWRDEGLAPATMATYVSHLRTLCLWLGKPELNEVIDRFLAPLPQLTQRHTATDRDKSEQGAGIDAAELVERAYHIDQRFACQLSLIIAFGLRARESWLFHPHLAETAPGRITVAWGTKGGRPRVLPIAMTDAQRQLLEWAKTFAANRADSMVPPNWRLREWGFRFYRLCKGVGLTRRDLGATPHSLRHGVLLNLYEQLTSVPAPVRNEGSSNVDANADRSARKVVAEFAGHGRPAAASAYLGGVRGRAQPKGDSPPAEKKPDSDPEEPEPSS